MDTGVILRSATAGGFVKQPSWEDFKNKNKNFGYFESGKKSFIVKL